MKDLEKLVENYFPPEKKDFLFESLVQLVEEVLTEREMLQQLAASKGIEKIDVEDILGTLQIDIKKWGTRSSPEGEHQERKIIQNYIKSIGGDDPDTILANLQVAFEEESAPQQISEEVDVRGNCNLAKVVSKIQLLNTLSTIVNNFDPSAAGYIMEGFLSAVFPGGNVVKVRDSLGVEDFVVASSDGDVHYSLKTKVAGSSFGGSIVDLVRSIEAKGEIIYYIFGKIKDGDSVDSIAVHKVIIDAENLFTITNVTEEQVSLAREIIARQDGRETPEPEPEEVEDPAFAGEQPLDEEKKKKLPRGAGEFTVKAKNYYTDNNKISTLTIDSESLVEVARLELAGVVDQLVEIQKRFKKLIFEMNHYFSSMDSWSAEQLKSDALSFAIAVDENIKGDETCKSV